MADKEPVSLDALNGLLKERQRYEEWLNALEQKRANTSESVFSRVQGDYQTRLREVSSKLAEHASELRDSIETLSTRLEEISRQEHQQREARQEAELRAAVGEYTDKQWKEIGGAWDKELPRVRCGELSDRVVLRAMWRRISHDVKRAPRGALFICRVEKLLGCLREATLVSGGRVLMDETFARRAIEEPDGR